MKSKIKMPRVPAKDYDTVGVRFANDPARIWTYRVKRGAKLKRGDELVADTPRGPAVVFVVRVDKTPQDTDFGVNYKYVTRRTVAI